MLASFPREKAERTGNGALVRATAFELSWQANVSGWRKTLSKRALYQGTTSVVPQSTPKKNLGFSPCNISNCPWSPFRPSPSRARAFLPNSNVSSFQTQLPCTPGKPFQNDPSAPYGAERAQTKASPLFVRSPWDVATYRLNQFPGATAGVRLSVSVNVKSITDPGSSVACG